MRNELLERRHVKQVMKLGIRKEMATEIVRTAMDGGYDNIEFAIGYAVDLAYGLGLNRRKANKC